MPLPHPGREHITGLVLCGGLGSRMGGADKGLQLHRGRTLVQHALDRLAPQVGPLAISANRHLDVYRALGLPVWPDVLIDAGAGAGGSGSASGRTSSGAGAGAIGGPVEPGPSGPPAWSGAAGPCGPLAGWLSGLRHCRTPYLATVPCDSPGVPLDLVARLADALQRADADMAIAATPAPRQPGQALAQPHPHARGRQEQLQPVFSLLKRSLAPVLAASLQQGERKIARWAASQRCVHVLFDDPAAFFNVNTHADLAQIEAAPMAGPATAA